MVSKSKSSTPGGPQAALPELPNLTTGATPPPDPRLERLMNRIAELISERGYEQVRISDIVRHAAISRQTFYGYFESKEEAFIAALEAMTDKTMKKMRQASAGADDWPHFVKAGIAAMLSLFAAEPAYAHICLVDSISATPRSTQHYEEFLLGVCDFLGPSEDDLPPGSLEQLPGTISETIGGGVFWILFQAVRQGRDATMHTPELVEFALAPYLGPDEARKIAAEPYKTYEIEDSGSGPSAPDISIEQLLHNAARIRARQPVGTTDPDAATLIREDRDR